MILPRDGFPDLRIAHTTLTGPPAPRRAGHAHFWQRALSRRGFLATSAGVTAAIAGANLWMPAIAQAHERDEPDKRTRAMPRPIPGGLMLGGTLFHVFLPSVDHNAEPSTISDFDGTVGFADITGAGTAEDTRSGHKQRLLFDVDVRFMKGRFVATDGRIHRGAFAFIWLDLFRDQLDPANQIHDFNPGIAPSGLFWTIPVSDERVRVDLDDATAALKLEDADVEDYFTLGNALADGPSVPAEVSFHVRWRGVERRVQRRDPVNTFTGSFIEDLATIRWSARERGFRFTSDPAHTSSTAFAEIGTERNGVFFS